MTSHLNPKVVFLSVALCLVTACQKKGAVSAFGESAAAAAKRYVAIRQNIEIETAESGLRSAWTSTLDYCNTIRCEVRSSSIVNRTAGSAPSGSISVRVAPDDLRKLLDQLGKTGNLVRQSTAAEDKTAAVIDVEARIRNLTEFRDSLRSLLGRSNANLRDLIEVRKQLADVQSELDSEATKRKVLTDETEKIEVDIRFSVKDSGATLSGLGKIGSAFGESISVLSESIATLITFIFAVLPWLSTLLLAGWLALKMVRRRKTRSPAGNA